MDLLEETFPPFIRPERLRERGDAFERAVSEAASAGAGALFYVGRFELVEFAVVLEPEEPLRLARKAFFAGMNALADTLSVLSPPEKPITFRWPDALFFDGALVGGGRLAWPKGADEDSPPDWLVFGAMLRAGGMRDADATLSPTITTLDDEGFEAWTPERVAAGFARHLGVEIDSWGERGFAGIGPRYLSRLEKGDDEGKRGIDTNGDLLVHPQAGGPAMRRDFREGLARVAWFDPLRKEPLV